jgi:hypothetical protein
MLNKTARSCSALVIAAALTLASCGNTITYPNQINAFDGATYSTLLVANGVLSGLRASVGQDPQYTATYNSAAASYNLAVTGYSAFRTAPNASTATLVLEIAQLTPLVVALEVAIQAELHPTGAMKSAAVAHAKKESKIIARAAKSNVSLQTILTELELAAAIAQLVPGAGPYAALAQVILGLVSTIDAKLQATAGQPINLAYLTVIAPLTFSGPAAIR